MKIFLVGYMGSGKTKTGQAIAKLLHYTFIDIDSLVESKAGMKVSTIFEKSGQEQFRLLESGILRDLQSRDNLVVATGGGLPCFHGNMDWMNANGITVYLQANSAMLFQRLLNARKGRPLIENLSEPELKEQINHHLDERIPQYEKAKLIFPAIDTQVRLLSEEIKKLIAGTDQPR